LGVAVFCPPLVDDGKQLRLIADGAEVRLTKRTNSTLSVVVRVRPCEQMTLSHAETRRFALERRTISKEKSKMKSNNQLDMRYITDKLFRRATNGLTVAELLNEDSRLANHSPNQLQAVMNALEADKLVYSEHVEGRGKVYRPLVFDTFEDLCRAKTNGSIHP
jgi:hypothetical protein